LMPRNILDDIVRDKRDELRRRQQATPLASLEARCRDLPPARDSSRKRCGHEPPAWG